MNKKKKILKQQNKNYFNSHYECTTCKAQFFFFFLFFLQKQYYKLEENLFKKITKLKSYLITSHWPVFSVPKLTLVQKHPLFHLALNTIPFWPFQTKNVFWPKMVSFAIFSFNPPPPPPKKKQKKKTKKQTMNQSLTKAWWWTQQ